jgi:phosphotransacetylase
MKGSLHTDEPMGAVVPPAKGLRTERRIRHVFAMDVPACPRPLFITDAAINISPTLEDKVDILKNAIHKEYPWLESTGTSPAPFSR